MKKEDLEKKTKKFAIQVIRFVSAMPKSKIKDVIGYQLLKAGTSIGANYREANRAVSRADFINKIGIVEKEASECQYWLELCDSEQIGDAQLRKELLAECGEVLAIFTSVGKTAKRNTAANSKFEIRISK